jgi:hypothetical protein
MWPKPRRRTSLFGLSTPEVYPAGTVTRPLVRSYRTFSPLPFSFNIHQLTFNSRSENQRVC